MPGGFRLKLVLTRLSSFGQEWRRFLGQSAQAREKLFVSETVEIVVVEIDVVRQQRGNHLEIGSGARTLTRSIVSVRCLSKSTANAWMKSSPNLFREPFGRPELPG